jgi:hypothetical protein
MPPRISWQRGSHGCIVRAGGWKRVFALLLAAVSLHSAPGRAQFDAAIPESELREPWVQQLAVLQSLAGTITSTSSIPERAQLDDALTYLQVTLGEFETQVDQLIDRLVADPQFGYIAAETSAALGAQLGEIHARFDALYAVLGVQRRNDVRSAQDALAALEQILLRKVPFERDVLRALASGTGQQRVELATRWWNGEERAIAVKKLVAELRENLGASGAIPAGMHHARQASIVNLEAAPPLP